MKRKKLIIPVKTVKVKTIKPRITTSIPDMIGIRKPINKNKKFKYKGHAIRPMQLNRPVRMINPKNDIDNDGVPDFKDCQPFNPRKHSDKLFDEAKRMFGTTDNPNEAGWILPSGEMLDFSGKKFGHNIGTARGMGHIAIEHVVKKDGLTSIGEFQKKGAIRFFKEKSGDVVASMAQKPTREQAITLAKSIKEQPEASYLLLSRVETSGPIERDISTLESKTPKPILVQRFISKAFD